MREGRVSGGGLMLPMQSNRCTTIRSIGDAIKARAGGAELGYPVLSTWQVFKRQILKRGFYIAPDTMHTHIGSMEHQLITRFAA